MNKATQTYSRGQLDRLTGVKGETIRYYENCGLLPAPPRSAGGHRLYSDNHKERLIFIRRCRELGFTLNETEGLLGLADTQEHTCEQARQVTVTHLTDVRRKIKDLRKMERTLRMMVEDCETNTSPHCPIIDSLLS